MKVIFEVLPKESWCKRLWRFLFRKARPYEHVKLSCNGRSLIIQRGIVVDVPAWVPEVAMNAPSTAKYNCSVPFRIQNPVTLASQFYAAYNQVTCGKGFPILVFDPERTNTKLMISICKKIIRQNSEKDEYNEQT